MPFRIAVFDPVEHLLRLRLSRLRHWIRCIGFCTVKSARLSRGICLPRRGAKSIAMQSRRSRTKLRTQTRSARTMRRRIGTTCSDLDGATRRDRILRIRIGSVRHTCYCAISRMRDRMFGQAIRWDIRGLFRDATRTSLRRNAPSRIRLRTYSLHLFAYHCRAIRIGLPDLLGSSCTIADRAVRAKHCLFLHLSNFIEKDRNIIFFRSARTETKKKKVHRIWYSMNFLHIHINYYFI